MRYYIIFGVTLVLVLIILFFNPFLGVFKNQITIEYNYNDEGYSWEYTIDGESLKISEESDNKWVFKVNKNGLTSINYSYKNEDNIKYQINYKFRVFNNKIYWIKGSGKGLLDFPNPY